MSFSPHPPPQLKNGSTPRKNTFKTMESQIYESKNTATNQDFQKVNFYIRDNLKILEEISPKNRVFFKKNVKFF